MYMSYITETREQEAAPGLVSLLTYNSLWFISHCNVNQHRLVHLLNKTCTWNYDTRVKIYHGLY